MKPEGKREATCVKIQGKSTPGREEGMAKVASGWGRSLAHGRGKGRRRVTCEGEERGQEARSERRGEARFGSALRTQRGLQGSV